MRHNVINKFNRGEVDSKALVRDDYEKLKQSLRSETDAEEVNNLLSRVTRGFIRNHLSKEEPCLVMISKIHPEYPLMTKNSKRGAIFLQEKGIPVGSVKMEQHGREASYNFISSPFLEKARRIIEKYYDDILEVEI